jgi:hypothetical protein
LLPDEISGARLYADEALAAMLRRPGFSEVSAWSEGLVQFGQARR